MWMGRWTGVRAGGLHLVLRVLVAEQSWERGWQGHHVPVERHPEELFLVCIAVEREKPQQWLPASVVCGSGQARETFATLRGGHGAGAGYGKLLPGWHVQTVGPAQFNMAGVRGRRTSQTPP